MPVISEAQLAANRANSQKSTGPRTDAGKKRASLNALKHGGSAQTIILPGEDALHFQKFHHSFKLALKPVNAVEESLVSTLADTQWVIDRMRAHEVSMFALGHEKFADTIDTGGDEVIQSALAGAKVVKVELDTLKTTSVYLQRNMRMYDTTLKQFLNLQAIRKAEELTTVKVAAKIAQLHLKLKIPFNPNDYGLVCSSQEIEFFLRRENAYTQPYIPPTPLTKTA